MAKLDYKQGRFDVNSETGRIFDGMEGWQESFGDWLSYYKLDEALTVFDDVYEEAAGKGIIFSGPIRVGCQHILHQRGGNEYGDTGFYYNDTLSATISYRTFSHNTGLALSDIDTGRYMRDRVVYDQKVFKITELSVKGQIQERDTIVALEATQVKDDELVDCPQLIQYAVKPNP